MTTPADRWKDVPAYASMRTQDIAEYANDTGAYPGLTPRQIWGWWKARGDLKLVNIAKLDNGKINKRRPRATRENVDRVFKARSRDTVNGVRIY